MMQFTNGQEIKSEEFHNYRLASMSEEDLGRLAQKCLQMMQGGPSDLAAAMLKTVSDEKSSRAAKISAASASRWSKIAVLAILLFGILQVAVNLWMHFDNIAYEDQQQYDECEQPADMTI